MLQRLQQLRLDERISLVLITNELIDYIETCFDNRIGATYYLCGDAYSLQMVHKTLEWYKGVINDELKYLYVHYHVSLPYPVTIEKACTIVQSVIDIPDRGLDYLDVECVYDALSHLAHEISGMTDRELQCEKRWWHENISGTYMCNTCYKLFTTDSTSILDIPACDCNDSIYDRVVEYEKLYSKYLTGVIPHHYAPNGRDVLENILTYPSRWIQVDRPIANEISLLNKKGWYTTMCCSGHGRINRMGNYVGKGQLWVSFTGNHHGGRLEELYNILDYTMHKTHTHDYSLLLTFQKGDDVIFIESAHQIKTHLNEEDWDDVTRDTINAFQCLVNELPDFY